MDERKKILNMLAEGKISTEDAEKLLSAAGETKIQTATMVNQPGRSTPNFFCVEVDGTEEKVNIRIPLKVIKAGMKLTAFIPESVRAKTQNAMGEKGINFDLKDLSSENIDDFLISMKDFTVDIETAGEKVKIYCD